jgi:hypothetical protein
MTIHGLSSTIEYSAWAGARRRCHLKTNKAYADYGGRGIVMCEAWRNDFLQFLSDMGKKPHPALTLERRDNNQGYNPQNCYWATKAQQAWNRRSSKLTERKARHIRWFHKKGWGFKRLGKIYGVDKGHIKDICNYRVWFTKDKHCRKEIAKI